MFSKIVRNKNYLYKNGTRATCCLFNILAILAVNSSSVVTRNDFEINLGFAHEKIFAVYLKIHTLSHKSHES